MNTIARATIRWLSKEEGGRAAAPLTLHHVVVSRFQDTAQQWPQKAWSLVIDFDTTPQSDKPIAATIRFLSENGPSELLYNGSQFELLDGFTIVARGEVQ